MPYSDSLIGFSSGSLSNPAPPSKITDVVIGTGAKAVKGDILPGWNIQEDATSINILNSSGSTGYVAASFRRVKQTTTDQTPNSGPSKSSEYLLDQPCTFTHPTLGTITGFITDQSDSDGIVDFDMSTILDTLNVDIDAPPFVTGSKFYSFNLPAGQIVYDIGVMPSGDVLVAANTTTLYRYSRFGTLTQTYTLPAAGKRVYVDASSNIYVMTATTVLKIAGTTISTLITASSGGFFDMTYDPVNGMLYLLSTVTTAGQAVQKYNMSGTLQTAWGTYKANAATLDNLNPPNGTFQSYMGIGVSGDGSAVYVASEYNDKQYYWTPMVTVEFFTNTGTHTGRSDFGYNTDPKAPMVDGTILGYTTADNVIRMQAAKTPDGSWMMLTAHPGGLSSGSFPRNSAILNSDSDVQIKYVIDPNTNGQFGIGVDPNGFGMYVGMGNKIFRMAGGTLSPYQAMECYIGMTGFGSVRPGVINYTNQTTAQLNAFDGGYFPSWSGNLWNYLKQLAASRRFYFSGANDGQINVTSLTGTLPRIDIRGYSDMARETKTATNRTLVTTNLQTQPTISLTSNSGTYLYEAGPDDGVITVDYGEINTTTVDANAYPVSIGPSLNLGGTTWIYNQYLGPATIYMVSDSSNPPTVLSNSQFTAAGGDVRVQASDNLGSLDIIVTGPKAAISGFTAPFSLAWVSNGNKLPALAIAGNGIITNPQNITMYTGASASITPEASSAQIDSPFITSASIAYDTANPAAITLGHGEDTLTFKIPLRSTHVLGSIGGSVFLHRRVKWRVISAKISDGMIEITAERYTTVADVTPNAPAMTTAQMDALWSGYRVQDNWLSPGIIKQ